MFSSAVRQGSRRFSWKSSTVRAGSSPVRHPASGLWSPASTRSRVVLPQPEGPESAVTPRSGRDREKSSSTRLSP